MHSRCYHEKSMMMASCLVVIIHERERERERETFSLAGKGKVLVSRDCKKPQGAERLYLSNSSGGRMLNNDHHAIFVDLRNRKVESGQRADNDCPSA